MKIDCGNEKITLIDNNKEVGELCFKKINGDIVLMGTYINKEYRGLGYFKILLKTLLDNKRSTIYICCVEPFIYHTIEEIGFERIKEPIPYWGLVGNGVNFKYNF